MSNPNTAPPWHGWTPAGWSALVNTTLHAAASAAASGAVVPAADNERYDVVRVRYRDAACRGAEREVVYDHADELPRGTEPTTCTRDLTTEPPMTFGAACHLAERSLKPRPLKETPQETPEGGPA